MNKKRKKRKLCSLVFKILQETQKEVNNSGNHWLIVFFKGFVLVVLNSE
jgi:hypothetical protein